MNPLREKLTNEKGVTLVEIIAAIAILTLIVTAFLAFFVQAADTNNRTDTKNEATFIAQERMEHVVYFNQGNLLDDYDPPANPAGYTVSTSINRKTMSDLNKDIQNASEDDAEILYQVTITVEEVGGNDSATMETWLPINQKSNGTE